MISAFKKGSLYFPSYVYTHNYTCNNIFDTNVYNASVFFIFDYTSVCIVYMYGYMYIYIILYTQKKEIKELYI